MKSQMNRWSQIISCVIAISAMPAFAAGTRTAVDTDVMERTETKTADPAKTDLIQMSAPQKATPAKVANDMLPASLKGKKLLSTTLANGLNNPATEAATIKIIDQLNLDAGDTAKVNSLVEKITESDDLNKLASDSSLVSPIATAQKPAPQAPRLTCNTQQWKDDMAAGVDNPRIVKNFMQVSNPMFMVGACDQKAADLDDETKTELMDMYYLSALELQKGKSKNRALTVALELGRQDRQEGFVKQPDFPSDTEEAKIEAKNTPAVKHVCKRCKYFCGDETPDADAAYTN